MVYYFVSNVTDPPATIYVGKDKFENEELIKYGWEEDVWVCVPFPTPDRIRISAGIEREHGRRDEEMDIEMCLYCVGADLYGRGGKQFHVDNLSSAHVYLRMAEGQTWDQLPKELVEDCAQLTKANSIEGNKKDNITILYTPWTNLRKDNSMATGQVSFQRPALVRKLLVPTRSNPTINRLSKTRLETPASDLQPQREAHLAAKRKEMYTEKQARAKEEERTIRARREEKEKRLRGWDEVFGEEAVRERGVSNGGEGGEGAGWDEEDFM